MKLSHGRFGWSRQVFTHILAGLALCGAVNVPLAHADTYPSKPIRLVIPYAPGAGADLLGRLVAERLTRSLGQTVIVDNRAGAGGSIGAAYVASALPDGYTLVLGTDATHAANQFLSKQFPYDANKNFTPIAPAAQNRIVLVGAASLPIKTIDDLIKYAKANPNTVSYGSSGPGSAHHLAGELLNKTAGINMVHVPYRGGGPAMIDLLGGQIPLVFASLATAKSYIDSKKIKALGFVESVRFSGLPDVPSIGETISGYGISSWFAFFGPAGLPKPIVDRLNVEINKILSMPEIREQAQANGMSITGGSAEALAALLKTELPLRESLIHAAGIVPQ